MRGRDLSRLHASFLKRGKEPMGVLFLGDSITEGWNKAPEVWDRRDLFNILYGTPPMYMFDKAIWAKE